MREKVMRDKAEIDARYTMLDQMLGVEDHRFNQDERDYVAISLDAIAWVLGYDVWALQDPESPEDWFAGGLVYQKLRPEFVQRLYPRETTAQTAREEASAS